MTPNNQLAEPVAERAEMEAGGLEEAVRLAEIGEFLYNSCAYSYGDGYTEPREYGIEWQWQQSKPHEYGQGQLLAASTKWHADQAEDGTITEATKLRRALASPAAISGEGSGAVAVAEEATAGLCPRCAGTGRDPSTTALQCCKCMGSGAVVLRAALTVEPQGEAVPVAITEAMVRKATWAYEREITKAVDGGLNSESFGEARTAAIRAALTAALATAPEGTGGGE